MARWRLLAVLADVDFFLPAELLLLLPGFHLAARWHRKRWLRLLYRASQLVQLLQYALWADRFYLALAGDTGGRSSGKQLLHCANTFGVLTMMLARMLVLRWFLPEIEQYKGYQRQRRRQTTAATNGGHRVDSLPTIVTIALTFQTIGLADRAVFCFSRTYRRELYEVPANVTALGPGWWPDALAHLLSFDFAWRWAAAYNASLTTINTLLMGLADDLAHLVAGYGRLLEDVRRRPKSSTGSMDWRQFDGNVARTVAQHVRFLGQLGRLRPFLRATFLVMFYSAVLFLALGTFMITAANGKTATTTYDVILSGFLFALLLECYWCCRLVDRLNQLNASIGTLVYGLEWPTELRYRGEQSASEASHYRQARAALSIIQSRTQIGLGISCGGMFAISSEAFTSLVKMTYTMLMFLRDTQS